MAQAAWAGSVVFSTSEARDRYHDKFKDFVDGTIDAMEWDGHPVYPAGIVKQDNVQGEYLTGPALLFALQMPEVYANDPPNGNGWVTAFEDEIRALNPNQDVPTVAEVGTELGMV
jgi:hypothetical protein